MAIHIIVSYFACVELIDELLITSSVAITTDLLQPTLTSTGVETEGLSCIFTKLLWLGDVMGKKSLLRNNCFTCERSFSAEITNSWYLDFTAKLVCLNHFPNSASKFAFDVQNYQQSNFFTIQVTAKVSIIQEPNHFN